MKMISQRELRDANAAVMDEVERGESYIVTRRGLPIARIVPLAAHDTELRCVKPAKARFTPGGVRRVTAILRTNEVLEDLRGER